MLTLTLSCDAPDCPSTASVFANSTLLQSGELEITDLREPDWFIEMARIPKVVRVWPNMFDGFRETEVTPGYTDLLFFCSAACRISYWQKRSAEEAA